MREVAVIQSTKASNAIEGIVITDQRLRSVMENDADLRDRSEGEIAGYRDVLQLIHSSYDAIPVKDNVILQLHKEMYRYIPIEGRRWKNADNVISETFADGTKRIRFEPVSAFETPSALNKLCAALQERLNKSEVEPFVRISVFILDFFQSIPSMMGMAG